MNADQKAWVRDALARSYIPRDKQRRMVHYFIWASYQPGEIDQPWDGAYRVPEEFRQLLIDEMICSSRVP